LVKLAPPPGAAGHAATGLCATGGPT